MKSYLFFFFIFTIIGLFLVTETDANIITVSDVPQLIGAVKNLRAGDTIEVLKGKYNLDANVVISQSGTIDKPILIRAKKVGDVTFVKKSFFTLRNVSYVTIEGFVFKSSSGSAVALESCTYCRVTRNVFKLIEFEEDKWVYITDAESAEEPISGYNRIDHNLFEDKSFKGNMITTDGFHGKKPQVSRHDLIDYNYFRNVGPRSENGLETIRLGQGTLTGSSGFTTIENNLFENCDGDAEIISLKCDDNKIRFNTFRRCQGGVCLRQSSRSEVEGNFFLGEGRQGTGGVRVYRSENKIFNNYFSGLTGSGAFGALSLTNGDHDVFTAHEGVHLPPSKNIFAFNTLVGNDYNIEIGYTQGGKYTIPPHDNIIANNIIVGYKNHLVNIYTKPVNQIFEGNIFYPDGSAVMGVSKYLPDQIKEINPMLEEKDGIWRLTKDSQSVNSSNGDYDFVVNDVNGRERDILKDVGAEEFSKAGKVRVPLKPLDVGPNSDLIPATGK